MGTVGYGSIVDDHFIVKKPLVRPANADLNMTLALALVALADRAAPLGLLGHRARAGRRAGGSLRERLVLLLLLGRVHRVVLRLHLQVELLVVVVQWVLAERHAGRRVVVVDAALRVESLLPALRFGRLQSLVRNPKQVRVPLDGDAN